MILHLFVQPRARRNGFAGPVPGQANVEWKLRLTATPVEGKANDACVEFLARSLGIARSRVRLLSGQKSRHKVVELVGVSEEEFLRLAADQTGLPGGLTPEGVP